MAHMDRTEGGDKAVILEENGIKIKVFPNYDNPGKSRTFYNPTMRICRELVLCSLASLCEGQENPVKCLDVFSATGGLQWKRHLGKTVRVTLNEKDTTAVGDLRINCELNGIKIQPNLEHSGKSGATDEDTPRPVDETPDGTTDTVEVVQGDANIILHQRQFSFIHLDPYGTTVQFLDAAFKNIYNKGVMVITSTDLASLYGKCGQVTMRNYNAYSVKTDYYKELAVRLVLAAAVRAAARCNKGIQVLYGVAVEHFVQVAVKICRGPSYADACVPKLRKVLHCQFCEERRFYPDTRAPVEQPYDLLPCDCHEHTPGKTAVELGPVWCGDIFSTEYIQAMLEKARDLKLSERVQTLLRTLVMESQCPNAEEQLTNSCSSDSNPTNHVSLTNTAANQDECTERTKNENVASEAVPSGVNELSCIKRKRVYSNVDNTVLPNKKLKQDCQKSESEMPPFFYNVHRRKVKGVDLPKTPKLVRLMRSEGYRASQTHFCTMSVRTDATLTQLKEVLVKHCPHQQKESTN